MATGAFLDGKRTRGSVLSDGDVVKKIFVRLREVFSVEHST